MNLPDGFEVRLADDVLLTHGGSVLVGGSPLLAMHLSRDVRRILVDGHLTVRDAVSAHLGDRLIATNLGHPDLAGRPVADRAHLTVVIPVRDRPAQLDRALAALDGLDVIVVDDASLDAGAVSRVARARGAQVLRLDHNGGPAAARNRGLASVTTTYVAFVDSDVVVAADTLVGLTAHFSDPQVVLVAPHVRSRTVNTRPRWFERYEESSPALGLGERAGVVRPGAAVAWLPSACLVGRTDRLAGGFDPALRVGEDVDLVWRLVANGARVRYDPAFEAHHDARPTLRSWLGRKFTYGSGGAALAARHPDNMVTAVLSPAMAVAALGILAGRPWSPLVALAGVARAASVLGRSLPAPPSARRGLAVRLSLRGLGWTLRQESALVLRHWWPVALLSAVVSRSARRVVISAMIVDVVATRLEKPEAELLTGFAGRRMEDLAYGAGLWCGALRARSLSSLKVRWVRAKPRRTARPSLSAG